MKKIQALFIFSLLLISCSKDNDTATSQNTVTYAAFGYFKGAVSYPNEEPIPLIFILEESNKLLVVQNSNTINESNNLLKGSFTLTGNQISGSYVNANILPPTTFNFSGSFDIKTAKISGTIGTGILNLEKRI